MNYRFFLKANIKEDIMLEIIQNEPTKQEISTAIWVAPVLTVLQLVPKPFSFDRLSSTN
jgi:hypothetical protein